MEPLRFLWFASGPVELRFGFWLDGLSLMFGAAVALVTLCVMVYSVGYMGGDPGRTRYFALLGLFEWSMLSFVYAVDLLQSFIFWELVGLSSFFLIGFWYEKPAARDAATKAFVMTRIGDVGLFIGLLMILHVAGGFDLPALLDPQSGMVRTAAPLLLTVISLLIFAGIAGKSAQLPLHTWLPDAMEGPTPVSALLHSATMVAAGVFLMARLHPLFMAADYAPSVILAVSALTALVAATMAMVESDIKRVLAYSSISQLGFMLMGLAAGSLFAGVFHLVTHAFFKALLFLCSGLFIHHCGTNDMEGIGRGGGRRLRFATVGLVAGGAALAGVPPLSGFFSKEEIFASLGHGGGDPVTTAAYVAAFLAALLTAYYTFRMIFLVTRPERIEAAGRSRRSRGPRRALGHGRARGRAHPRVGDRRLLGAGDRRRPRRRARAPRPGDDGAGPGRGRPRRAVGVARLRPRRGAAHRLDPPRAGAADVVRPAVVRGRPLPRRGGAHHRARGPGAARLRGAGPGPQLRALRLRHPRRRHRLDAPADRLGPVLRRLGGGPRRPGGRVPGDALTDARPHRHPAVPGGGPGAGPARAGGRPDRGARHQPGVGAGGHRPEPVGVARLRRRRRGMQFVERIPWVERLGISYHLAVDGFTTILVMLNSIGYLTGVLTMWDLEERVKGFFAFMLLLVIGVYGVFLSQDLFFLFFFYEVAVVPMYPLILIWGSGNREYAAMKLMLFLLAGSALLFPALLSIYHASGLNTFDMVVLSRHAFDPDFQVFVYPFVFVGFGVLAGLFPFHGWSPTGHVAAPSAVSMLHAGVLMKLGAYGILAAGIRILPHRRRALGPGLRRAGRRGRRVRGLRGHAPERLQVRRRVLVGVAHGHRHPRPQPRRPRQGRG